MDQVTARDSRNLLRAVQTLNVSLDLSTLAQRTIAAVNHVVPADMVTYNEVDLVRRVDRIFVAPNDERLAPGTRHYATFIRHIDEHPVIAHNARMADPVPPKNLGFSHRQAISISSVALRIFPSI
jgi:hypothetical protein